MGELAADLAELERLGVFMDQLAAEAAAIATGPSMTVTGGMMNSVTEASGISADLVDTALIDAVTERLGETGEVMVAVAQQYRAAELVNVDAVVSAYTRATGDWQSEPVPS